jgi:phenylacetate-CoA ligase
MEDQAAHGPFGHNLTYPLEQYVRFHQTSGTTGVPLKVPDTEERLAVVGALLGPRAGRRRGHRRRPHLHGLLLRPLRRLLGRHRGRAPHRRHDDSRRRARFAAAPGADARGRRHGALLHADLRPAPGRGGARDRLRPVHHPDEGHGARRRARRQRAVDQGAHRGSVGAKCFDHAGATEVGAHSFECSVQPGGTHLIESEYIAEILDPAAAGRWRKASAASW